MKKLFTRFSLLTCLGLNSYAQTNNLVVFSNDGDKFWVILNGVKQNANPETNVKVTGLIQPNYKAKVIFENKAIPDIDQTIYMMDGGNPVSNTEITYSVSKTKKGYKMRWMSAAPFSSVTPVIGQQTVVYTTTAPSDMNTTTTVTGNGGSTTYSDGGTVTQTTTTTTTGTGTGTVGMNVGVNGNGTGFSMNVNVNDGTGMNTTQTTSTTTTTTTVNGSSTTTTSGTGGSMNVNVTTSGDPNMNGSTTTTTSDYSSTGSGGGYSMPGYNGPYGCPYPMAPGDFESAKKSIESKSFDDTKLTMAKQIINSNCLLSSQVKEIMLLFSFEQTRLDLAKYSYGRTYDQGNYYKLNDAFTFESSIDELNKFIEHR